MARTQASRALKPGKQALTARNRTNLDHATLAGFVAGFGLLAAAMYLGGSPRAYVDLPAMLIVLGGTFGVTTACFSLRDIARMPAIAMKTLFRSIPEPGTTALHMLRLAELARKRGILELDQLLKEMRHEPLVHKAITMAVDGASVEDVRAVMQREIEQTTDRHARSVAVLRKAAEVAPAMGLIGTLIGLVQMLGRLEDPAAIGPGLAVALLTTFYGAVLANMVLSPLASKLERNAGDEKLVATLYMLAAESICREENPRRLELLLNAMLPPAKRISYFN